MKILRQNSNDGDVLAVVADILANDIRISTKTTLPESIAEDHDSGPVQDGFLRQKIAAQNRLHAKERKKIVSHETYRDLLRAFVALHRAEINGCAASTSRGGDLFEQTAALLVVAKIRRRYRRQRLPTRSVVVPYADQPFGIGKR